MKILEDHLPAQRPLVGVEIGDVLSHEVIGGDPRSSPLPGTAARDNGREEDCGAGREACGSACGMSAVAWCMLALVLILAFSFRSPCFLPPISTGRARGLAGQSVPTV